MPPKPVLTLDPADIPVPRPGLDAVSSEVLTAMLQAATGDHSFEAANVPDTPTNRAIFNDMVREHRALPAGQELDIPFFD